MVFCDVVILPATDYSSCILSALHRLTYSVDTSASQGLQKERSVHHERERLDGHSHHTGGGSRRRSGRLQVGAPENGRLERKLGERGTYEDRMGISGPGHHRSDAG